MNRTRALAALAVVAIRRGPAGCLDTHGAARRRSALHIRGRAGWPDHAKRSQLNRRRAPCTSEVKKKRDGPLDADQHVPRAFGGGLVTAFDDQVDTTLKGTTQVCTWFYAGTRSSTVDRGQNGKPVGRGPSPTLGRVVAQLAPDLATGRSPVPESLTTRSCLSAATT